MTDKNTSWVHEALINISTVLILEVLNQESTWGYNIKKQIEKIVTTIFIDYELKLSSLYTILRRLERNDNYIEMYTNKEVEGKTERQKMRRYYRITEKGKEQLKIAHDQWKKFKDLYNLTQKVFIQK